MYIEDSLYEALHWRIMHEGPSKVALLIIDEEKCYDIDEKSTTPGLIFQNDDNILSPFTNMTGYQQRILMYIQRMGCHYWSINSSRGNVLSTSGPDDTRTELMGLYSTLGNTSGELKRHYLHKPYPNAFKQTWLRKELNQYGIKYLVLMGNEANVCVLATVGTPRCPSMGYAGLLYDKTGSGATHYNFKVMTCNHVLNCGPANWSKLAPPHFCNLEFYSKF